MWMRRCGLQWKLSDTWNRTQSLPSIGSLFLTAEKGWSESWAAPGPPWQTDEAKAYGVTRSLFVRAFFSQGFEDDLNLLRGLFAGFAVDGDDFQ